VYCYNGCAQNPKFSAMVCFPNWVDWMTCYACGHVAGRVVGIELVGRKVTAATVQDVRVYPQ